VTTLVLTVMQFNIEYGGTGVDFSAVPRAIESAGADVVAVQEACGQMPAIAEALGWPHFDNRTQVVSRYPLLDPPEPTAGVVLVEGAPGEVFAVVNVHPTSRAYGPTKLAAGADVERVVRRECRSRLHELLPSIRAAETLVQQGIPVVLLGDFNAPSHRDWTPEAIGLRPHMTAAVPWPTSVAVESVGLVDVYRRHHPDAVASPGLTWPAARPYVKGYNPHLNGAAADRIDLMFVSGDVESSSIRIMGEEGSEYADLTLEPWPTDHRALVADLSVPLATPPPVVSASSRVARSAEVVDIRFIAAGAKTTEVAVRGEDGAELVVEKTGGSHGTVRLDTARLGTGRFDVALRDTAGRDLAGTSLWVMGPEATPLLRTDAASYRMGEPIRVEWRGAPGNRADWIAVHLRGSDPATVRQRALIYTGATVDGHVVLDPCLRPGMWPLLPGEYTVHLLRDDRPVQLASADFTVTP
jgi:endonuclease/exonuclease/phosphatase family metal-dependent hydrolase